MFRFSEPYRNQKREVAIWILQQTTRPRKAKVTAIIEGGIREERNSERTYDDYELNILTESSTYAREIIREAAELLLSKGHIDLFENYNDIYKCKIRATKAGDIALKEEVYEEDIKNYNSDKYYRTSRWFLPGAALIISLLSLCLTTCNACKKSIYNIQLQMPTHQEQQPTTRDSANKPLKTNHDITEKSDTTP